jgi:hypothetical protein
MTDHVSSASNDMRSMIENASYDVSHAMGNTALRMARFEDLLKPNSKPAF